MTESVKLDEQGNAKLPGNWVEFINRSKDRIYADSLKVMEADKQLRKRA